MAAPNCDELEMEEAHSRRITAWLLKAQGDRAEQAGPSLVEHLTASEEHDAEEAHSRRITAWLLKAQGDRQAAAERS